jgi:hypothetical protein
VGDIPIGAKSEVILGDGKYLPQYFRREGVATGRHPNQVKRKLQFMPPEVAGLQWQVWCRFETTRSPALRVDHFHPVLYFGNRRVRLKGFSNTLRSVGQQYVIRIEENDDIPMTPRKPGIQRRGLSPIVFEEGDDSIPEFSNYIPGVIRGAVVYDNDLHISKSLPKRAVYGLSQILPIVIIVYYDADKRSRSRVLIHFRIQS